MTNEIITQGGELEHDPFRRMQGNTSLNHGAVAIESERAIAEARGQMQLAKMFPRSMAQAHAELMDACRSPEFAASAFYSVPNRGSGPSIRFAEEVARCYGNFQYGHVELSRSEGKSEVEVYAWDVERNNRSKRQITVLHLVDTKHGPKVLRDQADIDNRVANVASKQMRGRILALVPKHLVAAGIAECKKTIAGGNSEPLGARINRMIDAFGRLGVTSSMLEKYAGHKLDDTTADELADLIGVFNAIKEGAKASDYFGDDREAEAAKSVAAITAAAQAAPEPQKAAEKKTAAQRTTRTAKAEETAQPEPEPEKAPADSKPAPKNSKPAPDPEPEPKAQPGEPDPGDEDESVF